MTNSRPHLLFLISIVAMLAVTSFSLAQPPPQEDAPFDDVRGSWTIFSKDIDGGQAAEKHVQINQNQHHLSGHFEGPNQSGGIQGTINGHHIVFSTRTHNVLTFRGEVDGNHMHGLYGLHGRHAEWRAVRND
jgi:hypothetical protein